MVKTDPGNRELYRGHVAAPDLVRARVSVKETDMLVLAERDLSAEARDAVISARHVLERHISAHPLFLTSLVPIDGELTDPPIVRKMLAAGRAAGVGPMAAVAGAICDAVGDALAPPATDLILENGGDLLVVTSRARTVGIYTGEAALDLRLGLRVRPGGPRGICTSSGRVGHSLSFGEASSATVLAPTAALADAAATAVGNRARGRDAVEAGLAAARAIPGVLGAVVVAGGRVGAWGDVELARV